MVEFYRISFFEFDQMVLSSGYWESETLFLEFGIRISNVIRFEFRTAKRSQSLIRLMRIETD